MIDHEVEHTFPLAKAGLHVNMALSPATAYRWALKGLRGERLETFLWGGRRYTSREAISRFLLRLSEPGIKARLGQPSDRTEETARASNRAAETF